MSSPLPHSLPYGMRDIKLTRYTDATATVLDSTPVDLPVARTLSFSESEDFSALRGDDEVVANHGAGPIVEWELESGGISFDAWSVLSGGDVIESGLSPNRTRKIKKNTGQSRPEFKIEGQVMSDSGGDVHAVVWRCKTTDKLEGQFNDSEFMLTNASGQGLGSRITGSDGDLWEFTQNETILSIVSYIQVINLAHGTMTSTTAPLTWTAVTLADKYDVQYKTHVATTWTDFTPDPTTATTTVTGLVTATAYDFRVRASNTAGTVTGPWSAVVAGTTA
jgi:hypothetical protein